MDDRKQARSEIRNLRKYSMRSEIYFAVTKLGVLCTCSNRDWNWIDYSHTRSSNHFSCCPAVLDVLNVACMKDFLLKDNPKFYLFYLHTQKFCKQGVDGKNKLWILGPHFGKNDLHSIMSKKKSQILCEPITKIGTATFYSWNRKNQLILHTYSLVTTLVSRARRGKRDGVANRCVPSVAG